MLTLRTLADLIEAGADLPTVDYETTDDPEGSPYWIVYSEPPPKVVDGIVVEQDHGRVEQAAGEPFLSVIEGGEGSVKAMTSVKVGQALLWRRTPESAGIACRVKAVLGDGTYVYVEGFNGFEWQQWTARLSELAEAPKAPTA